MRRRQLVKWTGGAFILGAVTFITILNGSDGIMIPGSVISTVLLGAGLGVALSAGLVNLKGIPTMILVSEASYHAVFDHCTAKWMNQAGVKTDFIRLEDRGITDPQQLKAIWGEDAGSHP